MAPNRSVERADYVSDNFISATLCGGYVVQWTYKIASIEAQNRTT